MQWQKVLTGMLRMHCILMTAVGIVTCEKCPLGLTQTGVVCVRHPDDRCICGLENV